MPREFIPNIDTANEEIVRLDGQIEQLTRQGTEAATLLGEAVGRRDQLLTERDAAITERDVLVTDLATARTQISTLQGQVDVANRDSIHAAAAAGVLPVSMTADVDAPTKSEKQLKGLERAIAGNVALQRKKV